MGNLTRYFIHAALLTGTALGGIGSSLAQTAKSVDERGNTTPSQPAFTVKQATKLIREANDAADKIAIAGIITAFSSPSKGMAGNEPVDLGLSKQKCLEVQSLIPHLSTLDNYKSAQKVLIDAGILTAENADRDLKTQMAFLKIAEARLESVSNTCMQFGLPKM